MKIIAAGLPKTGTKSLTAALRKLGFEVYDFVEHLYCLEREWDDVFERGWDTEKFYQMYKDVDAAVDIPASYFWEEIHKAFPDAKIILTVRDTENAWVKSLKHHYDVMDKHILARILQFVEILLQRKTGLLLSTSYKVILGIERAVWRWKTHLNEPILKMKYRAHNAHVLQNAPQEKLLVFNCREGWDPLCKFLEKPVPNVPFPHENVRAAVIDETANGNPIGEKYKKEVIIALFKVVGTGVFFCSVSIFLVTTFI